MIHDLLSAPVPVQNKKDFSSDQEVRWCPGCGDYSILAQMQKVLPELGIARENIVFISGIGCSSRFPYYMNTYGIHSIHGRAPTLATGLKIARPDLHVFVVTGDGDGFSIGGNHMLHVLRRNVNLTILLFNNRIYGLTKGQYSPTSLPGAKTKSSPMGSLEQPLNPMSVALASEATFVARSIDTEIKHLGEVIKRAAQHQGAAFVEILQNCNIFNDGAWDHVKEAATKKDHTLVLEHGKPMVFGAKLDKGIRLNANTMLPEVVTLGDGVTIDQLMVHDESRPDATLAYLLSRFTFPEFPVPLGVFRAVSAPTYEQGVAAQVQTAQAIKGKGDLRQLYCSSDIWTVSHDGKQNDPIQNSRAPVATVDEVVKQMMIGWAKTVTPLQTRAATTPLRELGLGETVIVAAQTSLADTLAQMKAKQASSALIVDADGKLSAIFSERDIVRVAVLVEDAATVPVGQCAGTPAVSLPAGASVSHAIHLMAQHQLDFLPVVDEAGKPTGVITYETALAFMA
jgi:2-oxoglutarate ferredoxin oxidoreductase subunit beta